MLRYCSYSGPGYNNMTPPLPLSFFSLTIFISKSSCVISNTLSVRMLSFHKKSSIEWLLLSVRSIWGERGGEEERERHEPFQSVLLLSLLHMILWADLKMRKLQLCKRIKAKGNYIDTLHFLRTIQLNHENQFDRFFIIKESVCFKPITEFVHWRENPIWNEGRCDRKRDEYSKVRKDPSRGTIIRWDLRWRKRGGEEREYPHKGNLYWESN